MLLNFDKETLAASNLRISNILDKAAPFKNYDMEPECQLPLIKFNMTDVELSELILSTYSAMDKYGSWSYRLGMKEDTVRHDAGYGGIGLTYNPYHNELEGFNIHEQVQGNPNPAKGMKNPFTKLNKEESKLYATRNSHYDTYSLSYRTPASKHEYLGKFLDTCKRTMVRSAVRIIYADQDGQVDPVKKLAGVRWHKDESMFENLRVNIPLVTDPIFLLEQEGHAPVHLEAGYAYSWDTNISHRAYAKEKLPKHRIHLMLGFSCWWDFNEETGTWSQNEFFGKKHPKDMLIAGDVIPGLQLT